MSIYKEQLKQWLDRRDFSGGQVLSVGCMNDDRSYFGSFACESYETVDNDAKYVPTYRADFNNISLPIELELKKNTYSDIFTFELWEYIYDPVTALVNARKLLKEGGRLWISAPFLYPQHGEHDPDFLRYTRHFWYQILPKFGFEIVEYQSRRLNDPQIHAYANVLSVGGIRVQNYPEYNLQGHLLIAKKL